MRAIDAATCQMLHESKKKGQILNGDALFVERQDEVALAGVDQKIGVFDALGNALVGPKVADVVARQEGGEFFRRNVGIDGHQTLRLGQGDRNRWSAAIATWPRPSRGTSNRVVFPGPMSH